LTEGAPGHREIAQAIGAATRPNGDLTLREAERILTANAERWTAHQREHELAAEAHREKHDAEQTAVDKSEDAIKSAVDKALAAAERVADLQKTELGTALDSHHREHVTHEASHAREHSLVSEALTKAESSMDKRLEAIDKRLEERDKAWALRFEDSLRAITNIEKGDVKQEGKQLGQGAVVAIIVGAISVVGAILGILVVIANFATGTP
jgi:hypothetical protein